MSKITGSFYNYSGIVDDSQVFPKLLLDALVVKRPCVHIPQAMNALFTHAPSLIPVIVNMLLDIPNGLEHLIRHFDSRSSFAEKTWWQTLCEKPMERTIVMFLLTQHFDEMTTDALMRFRNKIPVNGQIFSFSLDHRNRVENNMAVYLNDKITKILRGRLPLPGSTACVSKKRKLGI